MKLRQKKHKFNLKDAHWERFCACWNGLITAQGKLYCGKYAAFMMPRILKDRQDIYVSLEYEREYLFGVARYIKHLNVVVFQDATIEAYTDEEKAAALINPKLYLCKPEGLLDYFTHYSFIGGRDIWHDSLNDRFEAAYQYWHSKENCPDKLVISLNADGTEKTNE